MKTALGLAVAVALQCGLICDVAARGGSGHSSGRAHSTRASTVRAYKASEPKAPVEKLPNSHSWKHTAAPSVRIQKATSSYTRISPRASGQKAGAVMVKRNRNGKIARSTTAKREFMRKTAHPNGWPGHVVDHIIPLKRGGPDPPANMQWQTVEEAKAKDKRE